MKKIALVTTTALFLYAGQVPAEKFPVYEMETITVTANRSVSSGDETGTFEVITREEIKEGNYKSVSEVLQTIPGVYFASESFLGNRGTESNTGPKIRIRGNGAKLLIDGRPMNMTIYGCLTNNMLTLDYVERIEVTKGSESVLYGSDGLGGVINIITRDPEEFGVGFNIRGGTHGTVISSLEHENTVGSFGYFISGSLKRSDGYRGDSDFSDESNFIKLKYDLNQSMKIESSLNMYNGKWDDPGTIYNPQKEFWADFKRRHADITFKGWSKTVHYNIKAFHNEGHHVFTDQDGWHSRDYTNGFKADMVKNFSGGMNRLIVGTDGRWLSGKALIDDTIYYDSGFNFWLNNKEWYRENEVAAFASDRHLLMDGRFALIGGIRIVRNSGFGTFFCPKLGTVVNSEKGSIHLSYNRAFKSPPLLQTNLHKKSNPDLNPEIADHYEIGGDYNITEMLTLEGTLFYIDGKDKSFMKIVDEKPLRFENIGEWEHKGGELTVSYTFSPHFAFSAGYTFMDVGANTQYNPKHQGNLNVRTGWTLFERELSLNLYGMGASKLYASNERKNRLQDYVILDLYSEFHIHKSGSIVIGVNNILDKEYESVYGYPFPGAVFTAGIRFER